MTRRTSRPKGKKYFPVSITLTQEQIDWLQRQPNASELVRRILDDLITSEKAIEENLGAITLNLQLEQLKEKQVKLRQERGFYLAKEDNHWEKRVDGIYEQIVWEDSEAMIPKIREDKKNNEDAKIALRVLRDYDKAIKSLEDKISEVKKRILES